MHKTTTATRTQNITVNNVCFFWNKNYAPLSEVSFKAKMLLWNPLNECVNDMKLSDKRIAFGEGKRERGKERE